MEAGRPPDETGTIEGDEAHPRQRVQQLSQRVAHLEADLVLLQKRKAELEAENEALAAAACRPEIEQRLAAALAENVRLEAECERHKVESMRRQELEKQQVEISASFSELQGVVAQLVHRLTELGGQRSRLEEEKNAAEAAVASLRAETRRLGSAGGRGGRSINCLRGPCICGGRRGCHACRLRCRAETMPWPPLRPPCAAQRPPSKPPVAAELADLKAECEKLRQQLQTEQQRCQEALVGHQLGVRESLMAEMKTEHLRTEMTAVLSTLSFSVGDEEVDPE